MGHQISGPAEIAERLASEARDRVEGIVAAHEQGTELSAECRWQLLQTYVVLTKLLGFASDPEQTACAEAIVSGRMVAIGLGLP